VDIQTAILQLQMLQSNPSLISSMINDVRQLDLSLGAGTSSTAKPTDETTPEMSTHETTTERDFTNLTDAERIVYQEERTMKLKQSKVQSKTISNTKSTSNDTEAPTTAVPRGKTT